MSRPVKVVRQFMQSECGLCCAAMVLGAHGSVNQVSTLRRKYETGRDGLGLNDVAQLLRSYGLEVRMYRTGLGGIRKLSGPVIAYWDDRHLVVVESVSDTKVSIIDPAVGRRVISVEEFQEHYSHVVLHAVPGPEFQPLRERAPSVWMDFLRAANQNRRALSWTFALSLLLYVVVLGVPIATQSAINGFDDFFRGTPLALFAAAILGSAAGYFVISWVRSRILASIIAQLGLTMMSMTFRKLLTLPYSYFANRSQGELMFRMSSITMVRDMISGQLTAVILDAGSLVVVFVYIFGRSSTLGFATLVVVSLMVVVSVLSYRPIHRITEQEIAETSAASTMQLEAMNSIEILKVSGVTDGFFVDWRKHYERVVAHTRQRIIVQGAVSSATSAFQIFGPFSVLLAGLSLVAEGSLDLGTVVATQALTATALGSVVSLSAASTQFVQASAHVERLADILHQPDNDEVFGSDEVDIDGSLELQDVTFNYPGSKVPALSNISFTAQPGQRIAIVGSTGSGKSTLGKLLLGLYPVRDGVVSIGGHPLASLSANSLYRRLSYVPQEIRLSNRTIAENIDFGSETPDMELVKEAAEHAQLLHDIQAMPLGFHTQVREMGGSLSGGQRQRVALARAIARNPKILVLDEATSSLDTVTEAKISESLRRLKCTQIVIAHRLSTIVAADLILVLEDGRVVQKGRHSELIGLDGTYRDLVLSQVDVKA